MNSFDSHIAWFEANSITDPPADLDDMKRGIPYSDTSYADNYAGDQTQPYWINDHAAVAGVKYSPIKGTNLGFDYRFVFVELSNNDNSKWKGHFLIPSISQALPWEGGTLSLKNELRLKKQDYLRLKKQDYNTNPDGSFVQSFRNRLTLSVIQEINSYMSFEGFYRLELSGSNGDNYDKITHHSWGYLGVNFGF
jgi:hypothetical protein